MHHNLELAILGALHRKKRIRLDLGRVSSKSEYEYNQHVADAMLAHKLTAEEQTRIDEINWPDEAIAFAIYPQWDGEGDEFDLPKLAGIEACTNLASCTIYSIVDRLAPLRTLTKLHTLWLAGVRKADLRPLAQLTALENLSLRGAVTDLQPLAGLTRLRNLNLEQTELTDLSALAKLPNLKSVALTWSADAGDASVMDHAEVTLAALRKRKVKLDIGWPEHWKAQRAEAAKAAKQKRAADAKAATKSVAVDAARPARDAKLEAQIAGDRDDARIAKYAAWLARQGDPRGTLAKLAPGSAAFREHLDTHAAYLLGKLRDVKAQDLALTWKAGFIREATLNNQSGDRESSLLLRTLLALPAARFLTDLTIHFMQFSDEAKVFKTLAAASPAPPLRSLAIRDAGLYNLGKFPSASYPLLEKVAIEGSPSDLGDELGAAIELEVKADYDLTPKTTAALTRLQLPNLVRLAVSFTNTSAGFEKMFAGNTIPKLRQLKLSHLAVNVLVKRLPDVPLLKQLRVLELFDLDDSEAALLIEHAKVLAHLDVLDLRGNHATAAQRKSLAKLGPRVRLS